MISAPYVADSDTSQAAAEAIEPVRQTLRDRVFMHILSVGGATCDEVELACSLSHQSASARVRELALMRRIADAGYRRPTRSGRKAVVWKARRAL